MEFKGKVAIVTGGAMGMGEATCRVFAREGAAVVVVDINEEEGVKTAAEINAGGGRAIFVKTDVSNSDDVRAMVEQVAGINSERTGAGFGQIDVLVNVVGIRGPLENVVEMEEAEWDRVVDVNLKSVFLCSKYVIPAMLRQGGGSIVNVASISGFVNNPKSTAYAAAKGGVVSLTRSMSLDFARRNIRINAVAPGDTDTQMQRFFITELGLGDPDEVIRQRGRRIPRGRMLQPEEIAEVIVFLAGPRASGIYGTICPVDAGIMAASTTVDPNTYIQGNDNG